MFKKLNPWIKVGMGLVIGAELGVYVMAIAKTAAKYLADRLLKEASK